MMPQSPTGRRARRRLGLQARRRLLRDLSRRATPRSRPRRVGAGAAACPARPRRSNTRTRTANGTRNWRAATTAGGRRSRSRQPRRALQGPASRLVLPLLHQLDEPLEQIVAVLRAGRGLGMVLHREHRPVGHADAAVRAVEERDVRLLDVRRAGSSRSSAKPWFIETISTLPVVKSFTGWFAP